MDWTREGKKDMAITSIWPAAAIESAATQNPQTNRAELRHPVSSKAPNLSNTARTDCLIDHILRRDPSYDSKPS
jgi:hypothetical protein